MKIIIKLIKVLIKHNCMKEVETGKILLTESSNNKPKIETDKGTHKIQLEEQKT